MNRTFVRTASAFGFTLAALTAAPGAWASVVNYDFVVAIDTAGSLLGQTFNGRFSFDDAQTPTPGFNGEDLFALSSFSFDFNGTSYDLLDLSYGDAAFDAGQLLGLDAGAPLFSFVPAAGSFAGSFAYDFGRGNAGFGTLAYRVVDNNQVPEPATGWLMAIALLGAAGARSLRARR
jgi:hypothetical protein